MKNKQDGNEVRERNVVRKDQRGTERERSRPIPLIKKGGTAKGVSGDSKEKPTQIPSNDDNTINVIRAKKKKNQTALEKN